MTTPVAGQGRKKDDRLRIGAFGATLASFVAVSTACAQEPPPAASLAVRDTAEVWGGKGLIPLNKLQVSGTLEGSGFGLPGWRLHGQVFRTDGDSLSARVGDIQTVSNIEAVTTTRLFEAWLEHAFGPADKPLATLRFGLVDLNADFDSIEPASLMVNSSHGIGADLARSGLDGPSIFPVSAVGLRGTWNAGKRLTVKLAAFEGVAGDPDRPRAFAAARLRGSDGALVIGQADYKLTKSISVSAATWGYTEALQPPFTPGGRAEADHGAYASISSATPEKPGWAWWTRVGLANGDAQTVDGYAGAGIVRKGVGPRADDRIGLAIARASISGEARLAARLPGAETSYELTYQAKLGSTVALQPDLQYVSRPAGAPARKDALVLGLRMVLTGGYPNKAKPDDAADPTLPPDNPTPPEAGGAAGQAPK